MDLEIKGIYTAKDLIDYIDSLSYFVDGVYIKDVKPGYFTFDVDVPFWYRIFFGKKLKKEIEKKVKDRLVIGVVFEVKICSKKLF